MVIWRASHTRGYPNDGLLSYVSKWGGGSSGHIIRDKPATMRIQSRLMGFALRRSAGYFCA